VDEAMAETNFFLRKPDYADVPAEVFEDADKIITMLGKDGKLSARLGVDGLPGAGKTTLSCAISQLTHIPCYHFHRPEDTDLARDLPLDGASVTEHHRLFRTQDIEVFDVLIYLDAPIDLARERKIRKTKHISSDGAKYYDYALAKRIGDLAFAFANGVSIQLPDSSIHLKTRPEGGFRQVLNLRRALRKRSIAYDCYGHELGPEELLFLYETGEPRKGLISYMMAL
jgi:hypothetical protein